MRYSIEPNNIILIHLSISMIEMKQNFHHAKKIGKSLN